MSKMFIIEERVLYKTWIEADSEEEALDLYDAEGGDSRRVLSIEIEEAKD